MPARLEKGRKSRDKAAAVANFAAAGNDIAVALNKSIPRNIATRDFLDYAYNAIDPGEIIKVLIDPRASYPVHKEALFAALCAWTIAPSDDELRRRWIARVIGEEMVACEKRGLRDATESFPNFATSIMQIVGGNLLLSKLGMDFYNDMYFPIGALETLLNQGSAAELKQLGISASHEIHTVVEMMRVYHIHYEKLDNYRYRPASVIAAADALKAMPAVLRSGENPPKSEDNIRARWHRSKNSAAFAYAAASIQLDEGNTLLDLMRNTTAGWAQHGIHLNNLLGRCKYAELLTSKSYQTRRKCFFLLENAAVELLAIGLDVTDPELSIVKELFDRSVKRVSAR